MSATASNAPPTGYFEAHFCRVNTHENVIRGGFVSAA